MTRFQSLFATTFAVASVWAVAPMPSWAHEGHVRADPNAIIYNGNFSDGTDRPDHWLLVPPRQIIATGLLDKSAYKVGPDSLRVTVTGREDDAPKGVDAPPLQACVQQIFNRVPTRAFTVAGFFKKDASLTGARVIVRAKDAQWTRDLAAIAVTTQPGTDWTPFKQTMTLPADTDAAMVCFEVRGQGSAWLDEVTITEEPVTSAQADQKKE